MSGADIFWLFIFLAFLQPALGRGMLEASRLAVLRRLEQRRGSRVIALVHRQETLRFLGIPVFRFINLQDAERILQAIRLTDPQVPIDLIVHTPGGLTLAAEQIAFALRRRKAKVTVFIPHYAMSGGTLIALAAHELVMNEDAVLGAVDPQIGQYPADSILKVAERKSAEEVDDSTLVLADVARKAIGEMKQRVLELLSGRLEPDKAEQVAEMLCSGVWTLDYPISVDELREIGLPVSTDVPIEVYQLMNLYPQQDQVRPSVDYIPIPYFRPESPRPKR